MIHFISTRANQQYTMGPIITHVRNLTRMLKNFSDDAYESGKNNYDFFKFQSQATAA
jgi:hypothetical protein